MSEHTRRASERQFTHSQTFTTRFRSNVMRLAYLSADRIELQFASKVLARAMAEPTTAGLEALKRCMRFLLKYPRCIQNFERQEIVPKQITCYSDSNFAGCLQSRKSTSSCKISYGKHFLKSTSTPQAVVSLSSAEAEFYAAGKAAAAGIGCVSMMRDLGVILQQQGVEVKAKGTVMESTVLGSKSSWMQRQGEPLQSEEVWTYQTHRNRNVL